MEQMFYLAWRKVTAVTDEARKALSTRDDAIVTLEQLSAASAEPIEHLRNYVLAGVLTCDDERGTFPLRSSMLAIFDFWGMEGRLGEITGNAAPFCGEGSLAKSAALFDGM